MGSTQSFPCEVWKEICKLAKATSSLRPHIVQVMATRQGRILSTEEIYRTSGRPGSSWFQPQREAGPQPGQPGTVGPGGPHHAGPQQVRLPS